jgi:hypothetical protein
MATSDWLPPHVGGSSQGRGGELSPPPTRGGELLLDNYTWEKGEDYPEVFMASFRCGENIDSEGGGGEHSPPPREGKK